MCRCSQNTKRENMSKRRVVVTGMGILSPVGLNLADNWRQILAGQSGIGKITHFNATGFPSAIAGEVKDFNAADFMPAKEAKRMDRFIQLGMAAGLEAFHDSGLEVGDSNAAQIGVYWRRNWWRENHRGYDTNIQ